MLSFPTNNVHINIQCTIKCHSPLSLMFSLLTHFRLDIFSAIALAPWLLSCKIVWKVDNAIHWINHYPVLSTLISCILTYPLDSLIQPLNNWGWNYSTPAEPHTNLILMIHHGGKKSNMNQYHHWFSISLHDLEFFSMALLCLKVFYHKKYYKVFFPVKQRLYFLCTGWVFRVTYCKTTN